MNELAWTFAGSALRVAVVAAAAGVLVLVAARRRPALAAGIAGLGLEVIVGLSFLAFCPLPAWWDWERGTPRPERRAGTSRPPTPESPAAVGPVLPTPPEERPRSGLPVSRIAELWRRINRAGSRAAGAGGSWVGLLGLLVAGGVGIGLVRLLRGLGWVRRCRRRGRRLQDPDLLRLLEDLRRAMGCRAAVEVREIDDLSTAGTVGWWRPLLLLPPDWRTWTEPERRAVLAHELAHVCRADYLSGLWARLSVALHFYHPLVVWLAGRLRLQQELAADALGARFAGGRGPYLAALARLALRQDGRPLEGPARAFLPARGMLLRRVTMLRNKEVVLAGWWSGVLRLTTGILLVGIGLGVSALRLPARADTPPTPDAKADQPATAPAHPDEAPEPFDLSYLPADAVGLWAFRPAAAFRSPATRLSIDALALMLFGQDLVGKQSTALGLNTAELDTIFGDIRILSNPKAPKGQRHSLVFDLCKVRTVHPFDWKGKLEKMSQGFQTVPYAGTRYYKTARPIFPSVGNRLCFFTPDDHTIVFDTEETIQRLLDRGPAARPNGLWAEKWHQVERGILAVAINHRHPDLTHSLKAEHLAKDSKEFLDLIGDSTRSVWEIDFRDHFQLRIFADCTTESGARAWSRKVKTFINLAREAVSQSTAANSPGSAIEARWIAFIKDFYQQIQVDQEGAEVQIHSEVRVDFPALLNSSLAEALSPPRPRGTPKGTR